MMQKPMELIKYCMTEQEKCILGNVLYRLKQENHLKIGDKFDVSDLEFIDSCLKFFEVVDIQTSIKEDDLGDFYNLRKIIIKHPDQERYYQATIYFSESIQTIMSQMKEVFPKTITVYE